MTDGVFCADGSIKISDNTVFNNTGDNYPYSYTRDSITDGRVAKVRGNNIGGFLPTTMGGSETTYYCDYGALPTNEKPIMVVGGSCVEDTSAGIFSSYFQTTSTTDQYIGARLQYLAP